VFGAILFAAHCLSYSVLYAGCLHACIIRAVARKSTLVSIT
jgi:hypothetical protein